jgi:hypothetical protein
MTIGEIIGLILMLAMMLFLWVCLRIGSDDK